MKKFVSVLIKILLLVILALYLSDFIYTSIYALSEPRSQVQYILNTNEQNFDILFLGSSRTANHIDTNLFDSLSSKRTINFGAEGAGLNDNLLQLKLFVAKNKTKCVYLQVDKNYDSEAPSSISASAAMPFLKNEIISKHLKDYFTDFNKLRYIPFYRYAINDPKIGFREMFFSIIQKKPRIDPSNGFTPKFGTSEFFKEEKLPQSLKIDNKILAEIKSICEEHSIKLILFTTPYCSMIVNKDYIKKLKVRIPELILLTENYSDEMFFDCAHLNYQGARKLTENLYIATKDL